jgi:hypothetical protein
MAAACPQAWVDGVVEDQAIADAGYARGRRMDSEGYGDVASIRVSELLADPQPRMRIHPGDLEAWLRDGLFKTFHETGMSSGARKLELRLDVEEKVLGVARNADPDDRPKYGYVYPGREVDRLRPYGNAVVHLNSGLLDESNVMFGDSIGSTNEGGWMCSGPEPVLSPTLVCRFSNIDVVDAPDLAAACDPRFSYAELHIYGRITPRQIAEVRFYSRVRADRRLRNLLDRWAIPFKESADPPR